MLSCGNCFELHFILTTLLQNREGVPDAIRRVVARPSPAPPAPEATPATHGTRQQCASTISTTSTAATMSSAVSLKTPQGAVGDGAPFADTSYDEQTPLVSKQVEALENVRPAEEAAVAT